MIELDTGCQGVRREFADNPDAGGDKENDERAEQGKGNRHAGQIGRNFENEDADGGECQQQHCQDRPQSGGQHGEQHGEQIHQEDKRPDQERDLRQSENRDQHQHQRQQREDVDCPASPRAAATSLEKGRKGRVQDPKDKIKRERRVEQFIAQRILGPNCHQPENGESGDGLGGGSGFIGEHERDDAEIHEEDGTEHQPRAVRQGLEAQEPRAEGQRHSHQAER